MSRSKYEMYKESTMGQQVANIDSAFNKLVGADSKLSEKIGHLLVLGQFGIVNLEDQGMKLSLALLDMKRKARFATADNVNELTKLGFFLPQAPSEVDFNETD